MASPTAWPSRTPSMRSSWESDRAAGRAGLVMTPGYGRRRRPGRRSCAAPHRRPELAGSGAMVREGGGGSAVSGRAPPGSMCSIGAARAVLHIRPGPAGGGSAESCGNAPTLNAVEILPCAERAPLHMGARPLKTEVLGRVPESCGKHGIRPWGRPSPMCNISARTRRSLNGPSVSSSSPQHLRADREDPDPPGSGP